MSIPEGWAADADGVPTTDAREAVRRADPADGRAQGLRDLVHVRRAGRCPHRQRVRHRAWPGPYDPERRSGCGHFLMVVDVAAMQPAEEFASRMEALVAQTKANPAAPGVDEIFVPGEIEQRNAARNAAGIALPSKTWDDLSTLAAESGVAMPAVLRPPERSPDRCSPSSSPCRSSPATGTPSSPPSPRTPSARSPTSPAAVYFDVTVDTADDHHFVFYELYTDQAAIEAHRAAPHFAVWRQAAAEHVVPGSQVNTITEQLLHHSVESLRAEDERHGHDRDHEHATITTADPPHRRGDRRVPGLRRRAGRVGRSRPPTRQPRRGRPPRWPSAWNCCARWPRRCAPGATSTPR